MVADPYRFELWRKRRPESLQRRSKQRQGGKCTRCPILWSLMSLQICGKIDFKYNRSYHIKEKPIFLLYYPRIIFHNIKGRLLWFYNVIFCNFMWGLVILSYQTLNLVEIKFWQRLQFWIMGLFDWYATSILTRDYFDFN